MVTACSCYYGKCSMECRSGCGACCIGLSISSPIPGMPDGKPADVPCIHLDQNFRCNIFHHPERPKVCAQLKPCLDMCLNNRDEALDYLRELEILTTPC
ncbi:hypothetical protein SAMN02745723_105205 [Pragia fontium DSM 5563 = ATCC 49100]|uniref:YkgJ family cysteine cluster protein n=2 Tax=Pragia fontium TaxID=82985 RepID=A0AAJ5BHE5_9GAMM|nr:hypothetical protein SAMN02745723_105205 [Pragia fontium DSM 5563 = ATCC 49100]VEJ55931.1 Uncharacterised protein [Pragia fontium]